MSCCGTLLSIFLKKTLLLSGRISASRQPALLSAGCLRHFTGRRASQQKRYHVGLPHLTFATSHGIGIQGQRPVPFGDGQVEHGIPGIMNSIEGGELCTHVHIFQRNIAFVRLHNFSFPSMKIYHQLLGGT